MIRLSEEWLVRKVADYEEEKGRIAEIFERINDARVQFEVCAASSFASLVLNFVSICSSSWR